MEKDYSWGKDLEKLRKGQEVVCEVCGKGIYETTANYETSNYFHCNNCDNFIHITPNIIVE